MKTSTIYIELTKRFGGIKLGNQYDIFLAYKVIYKNQTWWSVQYVLRKRKGFCDPFIFLSTCSLEVMTHSDALIMIGATNKVLVMYWGEMIFDRIIWGKSDDLIRFSTWKRIIFLVEWANIAWLCCHIFWYWCKYCGTWWVNRNLPKLANITENLGKLIVNLYFSWIFQLNMSTSLSFSGM